MPASRVDDQVKMLRVLWLTMFVPPALFLVLGLVKTPERNDQHVPVPLLALAAVVIAVMSMVMPRVTLKNALAQKTFATKEEATGRVLADPDAALDIVMKAFASATITGLSCAEAVALLGFTAEYFERVTWPAVPFFLTSWALMALQFPSREKAIAALERIAGAKYRPIIAPRPS